jgi:threonine/homoserine/homoserine lactone efflux protein
MDPSAHLWLFFLLVLGIVLLPGLDMACVLGSTLAAGRRAGFATVAGIVAGGIVHVAVAATGVAVVVTAAPALFNGLLFAGAVYVAWIGVALARHGVAFAGAAAPAGTAWFRRGALTNLLNPKAYAFMLAVFPQFVRADLGPVGRQALLLGAIIGVTQAGVYGALVAGAARARTWAEGRPGALAALGRGVGALLIAAAIATLAGAWRGAS